MDPDDYFQGYEPDVEDIAGELERERDFESCESYVREAKRQFSSDCDKFTSKQVRELNTGVKRLTRDLWNQYCFDVANDRFEVSEDGEFYFTVSRDGRPITYTRKDKRRMKKHARTRARRWVRKRQEVDFDKRRGEIPCGSQRLGRQELLLPVVAAK